MNIYILIINGQNSVGLILIKIVFRIVYCVCTSKYYTYGSHLFVATKNCLEPLLSKCILTIT